MKLSFKKWNRWSQSNLHWLSGDLWPASSEKDLFTSSETKIQPLAGCFSELSLGPQLSTSHITPAAISIILPVSSVLCSISFNIPCSSACLLLRRKPNKWVNDKGQQAENLTPSYQHPPFLFTFMDKLAFSCMKVNLFTIVWDYLLCYSQPPPSINCLPYSCLLCPFFLMDSFPLHIKIPSFLLI